MNQHRTIQRVALSAGELAKELSVDLATAQKLHDQLLVHGRAAYGDYEMHATVSGQYVDKRRCPTSRRLPAPNKPW